MRIIFAAISVAIVMFVMNIITVSAFNMNVFSFIVHITDKNFSVNSPLFASEVSADDVIEFSVSPDDTYGMIAECAKYGIYPETPHYLPEDYVLTVYYYEDMPSYKKYVRFTFTNQYNAQQSIMFSYDLYEDEKNMSNAKFSNVEHYLSEIEINDKSAILAAEKKDKQFTVVYAIDTLMISIFTQDVSWEEVNKVINSMK